MSTKEGKPLVEAHTTRAKKSTTRKVAAKKTAAKKKSAKKITSKKTATKKAMAKKTAQQTTAKKTVAKKTVTKKRTSKKSVAQKRTTRKTTVQKPSASTAIAAKKEAALAKLTAKQTTNKPAKERRLLIPSPLRFPLDIDKLAVQTARYAGVFFVFVGALFTLWYSNAVFGIDPRAMTSQTVDSVDSTTTQPVQRYADSRDNFAYSGTEFLAGTVEIAVDIEGDPESVYLVSKNLTTGDVMQPQLMSYVSGTEWTIKFDTSNLEDGSYKFAAQVTYFDANNEPYVVTVTDTVTQGVFNDNVTVQDNQSATGNSASVSTTTSSVTGSTQTDNGTDTMVVTGSDSATLDELRGSLFDPGSPLSGVVQITLVAQNAERVKVLLDSQDATEPVTIGYADQLAVGEWLIELDTAAYDNGDYTLIAVLARGTEDYTTDGVAVSIDNQIATTQPAIEAATDDVSVPTDELVDPAVQVSVLDRQPLTGNVTMNVTVDGAEYVEVYAQPKSAGTQRYLGVPEQVTSGIWTYTWDTTRVANGKYRLFAKVRTPYGIFMKEGDSVEVYNETVTVTTEEELDRYDTFEEIASESGAVSTFTEAADTANGTPEAMLDELVAAADEDGLDSSVNDNYESIIANYQVDLDNAFKAYTVVLRTEDQAEIDTVRTRINNLISEMDSVSASDETKVKIAAYAEGKVSRAVERIEEDVERTNQIIADRTSTEAKTDTDKDGITDFDEVTIFNTDPLVADSDGDGFIDGSEVMGGYDPVNPDPEAAVVYESPQEVGVIREDVLAVHSITTEDFGDEVVTKDNPVAVITGRAFPNSFVTLYIFSTPVVVTVKTEADGSWVYRFDKELEDGEHQIYVGVTDNAGKIIAKSNPFKFVKEAQAFTAVDAPVSGAIVSNQDEGLLSTQNIIYLVVSIAIVAIGLVLIILGLRLEARPRERVTELKSSAAT